MCATAVAALLSLAIACAAAHDVPEPPPVDVVLCPPRDPAVVLRQAFALAAGTEFVPSRQFGTYNSSDADFFDQRAPVKGISFFCRLLELLVTDRTVEGVPITFAWKDSEGGGKDLAAARVFGCLAGPAAPAEPTPTPPPRTKCLPCPVNKPVVLPANNAALPTSSAASPAPTPRAAADDGSDWATLTPLGKTIIGAVVTLLGMLGINRLWVERQLRKQKRRVKNLLQLPLNASDVEEADQQAPPVLPVPDEVELEEVVVIVGQ
jgi:hypothetical protein